MMAEDAASLAPAHPTEITAPPVRSVRPADAIGRDPDKPRTRLVKLLDAAHLDLDATARLLAEPQLPGGECSWIFTPLRAPSCS
jgi:hypothetical protein